MKYNVVFLNPVCMRSGDSFAVDGPTYVAEFAGHTFAANGIHDYCFAVREPLQATTLTRALGEILVSTLQCLRPDRLNIVCVTHWTTNSRLARALMNTLRVQCRDSHTPLMVVGGGPFFAREQLTGHGRAFPDSIEAALSQTTPDGRLATYDAVVYGGFEALLQLLRAVEADDVRPDGGKVVPNELPVGYYHREGSQILGCGRSRNGAIARPPVYLLPQESSYDAMIMFSNNCPNGCDYCSTGQNHRFSGPQVREAIKEFKRRVVRESAKGFLKRMRYLRLLDPNPFADYCRPHTQECLEAVYSELGFRPTLHCFYDSYCFRDPKAVLADVRELNLRRMAVGREAVGEPGLSFMGRKHLGRPRTVEDLDEERIGLDEVIRRQKEAKEEFRLLLDYILTPADTRGSIREAFSDMEHFCEHSDDRVHVRAHWEPLWPNAGTAVMKKYTHLLSDDPYFTATNAEVWSMSAIEREYPLSVFAEVLRGNVASFSGKS